MPDPVCIANCVAEQAREPTAEELLSNRTSSLASTSTASLASLFSNGSKPDSPMTRDLSALMPWKTAGLAGQPDGQHGQKPQSSGDGNRQVGLHPLEVPSSSEATVLTKSQPCGISMTVLTCQCCKEIEARA